jgi:GNAT superfamily N-acetyltransferase
MIHIARATTDDQIAATFDVMVQLRPHLKRESYVARIKQLIADGFMLVALADDGVVRAVAGYRVMDMLHCGRFLNIDDLISDERTRSRGYGQALIGWLKAEARRHECTEIQLISHVRREHAHRFYFREGFGVDAFHFRATMPS